MAGRSSSLDRFYYLNNFELVLSALRERYLDLLSEEERGFMARFGALPQVSRALLVRMAMRKGESFRASKLKYSEIGDVHAAAAPLLDAGWVDARPSLSVDELQRLLTKAELAGCFALPLRDHRKSDLIEALRGRFAETKTFQDWIPGVQDCVFRLLAAPLCERFRLMFFGNFHQGWEEFVLADLRIFAYERIASPLQSRAFRARADIDAFQQLKRCSELLHAGEPPELVARAAPPSALGCDWLEDRRQRLMFDIARHHERGGDSASALAMYAACTHPGARMRVIRLHQRARRWEAAWTLCLSALAAPEDESERQQVRRLLPRLDRKLGVSSDIGPCTSSVPSFELVLGAPPAGQAVEWQVRECLAQGMPEGASVHYVENGLVISLFGLLCWRAIFAPVPGAFFHDFHRGPADLSSGQFCLRRAGEFAACLAELESGHYRTTIRQTYAKKLGIQSPFVAWNLVSESLVEKALTCFPPAHLKCWFEWIVRDIQLNRAGFPDLVQFWPREQRYRMIEVKGPGDRLQDNQRRLLEFCASRQMPVAVCYVRRAGSMREAHELHHA
jgi:hypothetical protein